MATANANGNNMSVFSVGVTGVLSQVPNSPFTTGNGPLAVAFSPSGQLVTTANVNICCNGGSVSIFSVGAGNTISQVPTSPYVDPTFDNANKIAFSPSGSLLAVGSTPTGGPGTISLESVGSGGQLSPLSSVGIGPFAVGALSFSSDSTLLAATSGTAVEIYSVSGGTLTLDSSLSGNYDGVAFSPTSNLLAVGSYGSPSVTMFSVTSGGSLTQLSQTPVSSDAQSVAFNSSGTLLAATNTNGTTFSVFSVNANGSLTEVPGSPYTSGGTDPVSVAFTPNGFIAVANLQTSNISMFGPGAPPTAQITAPQSGGSYQVGQQVPTSFSCTDSQYGPGIASCTDSSGAHAPTGSLNTSTPGTNLTYTVTAVSKDGQSSIPVSITYTVKPIPTSLTANPVVLQGVTAVLRRSDTGAPLGGQTLTFTAGGSVLCRATTDSSGKAGCYSLSAVLAAVLNLGYTVSFSNPPMYAPATANGAAVGLSLSLVLGLGATTSRHKVHAQLLSAMHASGTARLRARLRALRTHGTATLSNRSGGGRRHGGAARVHRR